VVRNGPGVLSASDFHLFAMKLPPSLALKIWTVGRSLDMSDRCQNFKQKTFVRNRPIMALHILGAN
jgi:hypothetical protein